MYRREGRISNMVFAIIVVITRMQERRDYDIRPNGRVILRPFVRIIRSSASKPLGYSGNRTLGQWLDLIAGLTVMRVSLISFFFLCLLAYSLAATPTIATRCRDVGSPCEEFGEATAIFIGNVLASEEVKSGKNFVIVPELVFKRNFDPSVSFFSCFDCMYGGWGYEFSVGEKYL